MGSLKVSMALIGLVNHPFPSDLKKTTLHLNVVFYSHPLKDPPTTVSTAAELRRPDDRCRSPGPRLMAASWTSRDSEPVSRSEGRKESERTSDVGHGGRDRPQIDHSLEVQVLEAFWECTYDPMGQQNGPRSFALSLWWRPSIV